MTAVAEETGLEDVEIQGLINGCGFSLWGETSSHTAAKAAHIRALLTIFAPLDKSARGDGVVT